MKKVLCTLVAICLIAGLAVQAVAEKKPFEGITLKWLVGTGHNRAVLDVNKDYIKETLGIELVAVSEPTPVHYALAMRDWMAGGGDYDIMTVKPSWNAELMGQGYFMPLDEFMDEEAWAYYHDAVERYTKTYCEWGGKVYAFVQDGDAAILYYRKDIMNDPTNRKNFKAKYGYELPVPPDTWDQLIDVAEFLNGWDWDNDGKVENGIAFCAWHEEVLMISFATMYMSLSDGKLLWDKEMHPQINNECGIKTLELMKTLYQFAPRGWLGYTWSESFSCVIEGEVALSLNYGDIGKLVLNPGTFAGSGGPHLKEKFGYSLWPATYIEGKPSRYDPIFFGRIIGIPRFTKYPEAAFAVVKAISEPKRVMLHTSNLQSGTDIFSKTARDINNWTINIDPQFIKVYADALDYGVPEIMIPASEQYYRLLGTEIQKYLNEEQDAKATLASIEANWERTTDQLGRERQKIAWSIYLKKMVDLGFRE